jgi:xanthine/uracil/vitamin C permease (AzgA family)
MACKALVKQSLVAATCISSAISCFLMAFLANMPLAVAPGMGINAYFTYQARSKFEFDFMFELSMSNYPTLAIDPLKSEICGES